MDIPSGGDKYRLIRSIGRGGMGVVYEAWDLRLERRVALKILHPQFTTEAGSIARVEREARNAARIEHPHVVRVYRIESIDGHVAIEMQYIDGVPLGALLAEGAVPPPVAADILRQMLEALAACHAQGVIHCDLKPANLLVTSSGHLYLTDFGISRAIHPQTGGAAGESPPTGPLWGTPRYTPPEAWRGERPNARWDLYSAGAVIHEALSGESLFDAPTPEAIMRLKLGEDLPPIRTLIPGLSSEFAALVDGLTARDPDGRPASAREALSLLKASPEFQSAGESNEAFSALYQGVHDADGTTKVVAVGRVTRRRLRAPRFIAIALTVLIAGSIYFFWDPTVPPKKMTKLDSEIELANSGVYFAYDDGSHGKELWHYNRHDRAAKLVQDIAKGPESSNPHRFFERRQDQFFFAASTPEFGEELWYAEPGIEDKARLVKDILLGAMGSDPAPIANVQSCLLFEARTLAYGHEIWCTNDQPNQTAMIADLEPGPNNSIPSEARVLPDEKGAYIVAYGGDPSVMRLWRYDMASNAVREIAQVDGDTFPMGIVDGKLILNNRDKAHGMELWIYDPAQIDIQLLADLSPGPEDSYPRVFITWRGKLYFGADTPEHGVELWCTDGTDQGTRLVQDLNPGAGDSNAHGHVATENALYFRATDDVHGQEIWMTDGTAEGTRIVADVWPGVESGIAYNIVAQGEHLFFTAADGMHGEELWMLDLDDPLNTCRMVQDLRRGPDGSEAHNLAWWEDGWGVFAAWTSKETLQLVEIRQIEGTFTLAPIDLP